MSVNDVRRGPGWWMDLEGGWNPPETWPEPSPPLPGWIRSVDGRWGPPVDADAVDAVDSLDSLDRLDEPTAAEIFDFAAPRVHVAAPRSDVAAPKVPVAAPNRPLAAPNGVDEPIDRPRLGLTYAERVPGGPVVRAVTGPSVGSAVVAALAAAFIAAMIATGMIMLVSLL